MGTIIYAPISRIVFDRVKADSNLLDSFLGGGGVRP